MKIFNYLIFIIVLGCKNNNTQLREQLNELKYSQENLVKELDSIRDFHITPFKIYESIILEEKESNPDSLINRYNIFINKYPHSFWRHEAERRIKNIVNRKKYWTEENGWEFDDIPKKPKFDQHVISCPGC